MVIDGEVGAAALLSAGLDRRGILGSLIRTSILEIPAMGYRQAPSVTRAQIVGVRITFGCEVIEPRPRTGVVIGQRDHCALCASRSRTLPLHVKNVLRGVCPVVDLQTDVPEQGAPRDPPDLSA